MTNKERAQLQRLEQFAAVLAADHEQIRPRQLLLLAQIALQPGLTQKDLARLVGVDPSTITRNLDTLGRDGRPEMGRGGLCWIEAKPSFENDREKHIFLTESGQRMMQTLLAVLWP